MADAARANLLVNNLAQQMAHIHGCGQLGKPVCDQCRLEASAIYSRLARQPQPA